MGKKITIIGLGAGDLNQLPFGVYKMITETEHLYLRTEKHPVIDELKQEISYESFDTVYEQSSQFEEVYRTITESLLQKAEYNDIVYAVPGHPLVAEKTVQLLLNEGRGKGYTIVVQGGQSFLDAMFQALEIDPVEGFQLVDAISMESNKLDLQGHLIITQVYDQIVASEVKLSLMEQLPDDYKVKIVTAAGSEDQLIKEVPLYEIDREINVNNLTSIYVPPVDNREQLHHQFNVLRQIIAQLRGPNGCPWDIEQTHQSLKKYLIEECYELIEAIDEEDIDHIIEELGDVLLQVVLHAQIGEDDGMFSIDEVIKGISDKMVRRHPHVFGDIKVSGTDDVLKNWNDIKQAEKTEGRVLSILDKVTTSLPALSKAYHLQKEAAKVGFDWTSIDDVWDKVKEEIKELEVELTIKDNNHKILQEFGDVIFALVNVGRHYKIEPEEALIVTNKKFYNRFRYIEEMARNQHQDLTELSLEEMDAYWNEAKKLEKEGE
ncbi:nucleoside triphosphate pyrophosphohydrolase [Metabacillus malikii]|uniref:Tetrapyrrole methylase family protein/MazG family protein n=1 Tax=Metabacillus malikii TaxID=1504265 RepID=A0ABT9ZNA0_9BACI|nr:nucleoside triphosphate pyrophosphohydrolase [Metabacillus malikii]MDQ0233287.1 tetrapyrrole methylase family protein/MazG family protein [Metabacillus malikii]